MIQGSQVNCVPYKNTFEKQYDHVVTRTQVIPSAFRVNYHTDGSGRDTFVSHNNGGFFKAYQPIKAMPVGAFVQKRSYCPPRPAIVSRGIYYHSDGTGRDNYIECNSGGLNNVH